MKKKITPKGIKKVEPKQHEPVEWMNVKRGCLPPYGEDVVVWLEPYGLTIGKRTHTDGAGEHWACTNRGTVTHWLNIVNPPK